MEQITLQTSNSRLLETVRAERNGITVSAEVTKRGGTLDRIDGSCSPQDGRYVSFSVYTEGDGYGRSMSGSESLLIEAGELIEEFITAVKAKYTESSTTDAEE